MALPRFAIKLSGKEILYYSNLFIITKIKTK